MESKVHQLIREARLFLESGNCTDVNQLIKDLTDKLEEYHPIVNPPVPATENPNVVDWRPLVKEGLASAVAEIQSLLGEHVKIESSVNIRRSVMKDGGIKAKLGLKFKARTVYNRTMNDPIKIIQAHINRKMAVLGLPAVAVLTTCGSQMSFSARVHVQGDEDYERWARIGRL